MNKQKISLFDIIKIFLLIGTTGFGGGMAIIALMQDYCVERKKILSSDDFINGVTLGQFMGPFALNAAIFVGYIARGFWGGLCAGVFFLLPSIVLIIGLSFLYDKFRDFSMFQSALNGISPVVIALIISAAVSMGKGKFKTVEPVFMMVAVILLMVFFKAQIVLILLVALLYSLLKVRSFSLKTPKGGE